MRLRPSWATLVQITLLAAFGFFLVRQGLAQADQWSSTVSGLIAFAGLLGLVPLASRRRSNRGAENGAAPDSPLQRHALHLQNGQLPLVVEVTTLELGVKPADSSPQEPPVGLPSYIARSGDEDLRWAVGSGGLVLVHGGAGAGTSRSAHEAIRRLRGRYRLLVPVSGPALRHLVESGHEIRNTVVWLDRAEQYLCGEGLDLSLLQRLCPQGRHDVVIVATMHDEVLQRLEGARTGGSEWVAAQVLQRARGRRRIWVERPLADDPEPGVANSRSNHALADAATNPAGLVADQEARSPRPGGPESWSEAGEDRAGSSEDAACHDISSRAGDNAEGISLRIRFDRQTWSSVEGRPAYVGVVDAGQLVEWYDQYREELFGRDIRTYFRSPDVQKLADEIWSRGHGQLLPYSNGLTIVAKNS
jgi:hypothetical protein